MTVADFGRKMLGIARERGVGPALRDGACEAGAKVASPVADRLARPIWAGDWDVCLVLDACRADLFQKVARTMQPSWLPATPGSAWSVAASSPGWISRTFAPAYADEYEDVGYVCANLFSGRDGDFCKTLDGNVVPLAEQTDLGWLDEPWRLDYEALTPGKVPQERVTERGLWAWDRRNELGIDRVISHYMSPHAPFESRSEWWTETDDDRDIWVRAQAGDVAVDDVWLAYRRELRRVFAEVRRWVRETDARILITSDHGNGLGRWGVWGHPPETAAPAVRRVPWVVVDGRGVDALDPAPLETPPAGGREIADKTQERLEVLGYA